MSGWRSGMVISLLVLMLFFLQYKLWFAAGGIPEVVRLKKTLAQQNQENEAIKKGNEELLFQIERTENSQDATEARARNELGMIKKDEVFYQIVK